ncbi:hypothetical protein PATY110618_07465 [Paenibacillus typhae]|uniref:Uncharacterized protein n=1 Tax=Paenibacillus typhae TaxID=1174501 RepID=A0A1G8PUU7_9BACL|nr:hypothetical protein SAMN05216192_11068 [Paenibacillus typhae]
MGHIIALIFVPPVTFSNTKLLGFSNLHQHQHQYSVTLLC